MVRIARGDVFWLGPDAERTPDATYRHPHVVVQDDVFNDSRIRTVIVCALTTNMDRADEPGNVLLDDGEANLPKRSVVVVSQITSVDKAQLAPASGRSHPSASTPSSPACASSKRATSAADRRLGSQ